MAKLGINTGSSPNDGTGDSLLQGAIKINNNFNEIYAAIGNGTTITNSIGYARTAGIATYAANAGIATNASYSTSSGFSTYSSVSGFSTIAGYATSTGISSVAQYAYELTGTPNLIAGIITATRFVGSGASLTGIVTSIVAGQNVTVTNNGGVVTIGSTASSAVSSQWTSVASGIVTTSNVGIGTTAAISRLQVHNGTLTISGTPAGGAGIQMGDGIRLNMGSGGQIDASIYYDAQDLRINTSSSIRIGDGNRDVFTAVSGEGSQLYYDGSRKLQTIASGVYINGNLGVLGIVTSTNLQVTNEISSGIVSATTYYGSGINLTGIVTSISAGSNISISTTSGTVVINAAADSRWTQNATGINTLSNVGIGTTTATHQLTVNNDAYFDDNIILNGRLQIPGNSNIRIGNVNMGSGATRNISIGDQSLTNLSSGLGHNIAVGEFTLYDTTSGQYNVVVGDRAGQKLTTGSYNVIIGNYDGNTVDLDSRTATNRVIIADGQGNIRQYINSSGNVGIKTTVVTEALTVAGVVSATSFYGTLNAGQLTGSLPPIDGSALIGVVGSGSGIVLRDDGSAVGTAGTIDFGSNLSVSFASGIATVTALNPSKWTTTSAGIHTISNVGIGTTNPLARFQVGSFATGGELGVVITPSGANGLIGVAVTNPTARVHIRAALNGSVGGLFIDSKTRDSSEPNVPLLQIDAGLAGNNKVGALWFNSSGNLGLGSTNPTSALTVQGDVRVSGVITSSTVISSRLVSSGDAQITGVVTASSFSGSASGLTNIPSGQLTGALPAIDGSALLNVTASGTGIAIESNGSPVGSAVTINLGSGLSVNFSAGIATVTSGAGQSRIVVSGATTSIQNNGIGNTNILGARTYSLMKVGLSTAGWLRLYTDSTSRDNDVNRSLGEDPAPGSGVIAEIVTTGISTEKIISPFVMGGNLDDNPFNYPDNSLIYASIKNLSGTTQSISVNLTILPLEV